MFVCKICGNEVKQGQAFCGKCGADVVENYETVCPICGTKNGAGSRYCARCGGILSVMRKPVCEVCGARNLPGAKYCVSCGAPININSETHSDSDMFDARKAKKRLDNMERDRMAAVDKEIAEKRAKVAEEKEEAIKEVERYKAKCEEDYSHKLSTLEAYKDKINELGAEDVEQLKKVSVSLKDYSRYYADPYSQIDEDDIETETYVCPACGTINPLTATACTNCGRNKARALLLLAKNKIKQSPPVKRKQRIIPAPEEDLKRDTIPSIEEFEAKTAKPATEQTAASEKPVEQDAKEPPADFSGRPQYPQYGYPYPPYPPYAPYQPPYPYPPQAPQYAAQQAGAPMDYGEYCYQEEMRRQMPPIVQPVAFVPYVTQEQPLMQYSPEIPQGPIAQPSQDEQAESKSSRGRREKKNKLI
ncbi:MAG: zinc ribbon domain-containing protein [Firmicutes bacterium]|nr:zinc ribbon domain-containing protein [Bacillota bacterium]MCM1394094.1 zinc ribbon domain-containing protein [[Eubacterium] siraeum]